MFKIFYFFILTDAIPWSDRNAMTAEKCNEAAWGMSNEAIAVVNCENPKTVFVPKRCVKTPPTTWDNI